jgi:hypothetical protein
VVAQRACKRCGGHPMSSVAEIAPFGGSPGLLAFICTDCGATDSVLVHAKCEARRWDRSAGRSSEGAPQHQV